MFDKFINYSNMYEYDESFVFNNEKDLTLKNITINFKDEMYKSYINDFLKFIKDEVKETEIVKNIFNMIKIHIDVDMELHKEVINEIILNILLKTLYTITYYEKKDIKISLNNLFSFNYSNYIHQKYHLYKNTITIPDDNRPYNDEKFQRLIGKLSNIEDKYETLNVAELDKNVLENSAMVDSSKFYCSDLLVEDAAKNCLCSFFQICYKQFMIYNYDNLTSMREKLIESNIDNLSNLNYKIATFFELFDKFINGASNYMEYFGINKNHKEYYLFWYQLFNQYNLPTLHYLSTKASLDYSDIKNCPFIDRNIRFLIKSMGEIKNIEYSDRVNNDTRYKYNDFDYLNNYIKTISSYHNSPSLNYAIIVSFIDLQIAEQQLHDLDIFIDDMSKKISTVIISSNKIVNASKNILKCLTLFSKKTYFNQLIEEISELQKDLDDKKTTLFTNYRNLMFFIYKNSVSEALL